MAPLERVPASGLAVATRVSSPHRRSGRFPSSFDSGGSPPMPTEHDLFAEEQTMATMSFGEHIEELRVRLILALLGLAVGVIVVFIPPLDIGKRVMKSMERPAKIALEEYYKNRIRQEEEASRSGKSPHADASGHNSGRRVGE